MAAIADLMDLRSQIAPVFDDTRASLTHYLGDCQGNADFAACFRAKCNPMLKQNHTVWFVRWNALDTAVRDWWKTLAARLRGIQRGVEPAADNEYLAVLTDNYAEGFYLDMLISDAGGWANLTKAWKEACLDDLPDPAEPPTGISGATPTERCPGALNNLKAELSLDTSLAFGGSGPIPKAGKKDIVSIPLVRSPVGPAL